jgi:hypothetical protein
VVSGKFAVVCGIPPLTAGFLQGMSAQIVKAVISQALLFMSKDQFEHWALAIVAMLYAVRKVSKSEGHCTLGSFPPADGALTL